MTLRRTLSAVAFGACLGVLWGYRRGWKARSRAMYRLERRMQFNRETLKR